MTAPKEPTVPDPDVLQPPPLSVFSAAVAQVLAEDARAAPPPVESPPEADAGDEMDEAPGYRPHMQVKAPRPEYIREGLLHHYLRLTAVTSLEQFYSMLAAPDRPMITPELVKSLWGGRPVPVEWWPYLWERLVPGLPYPLDQAARRLTAEESGRVLLVHALPAGETLPSLGEIAGKARVGRIIASGYLGLTPYRYTPLISSHLPQIEYWVRLALLCLHRIPASGWRRALVRKLQAAGVPEEVETILPTAARRRQDKSLQS